MNIRKNWSDNFYNVNSNNINNFYYTREERINEVQENFNIRRYNSAESYEVECEGVRDRVLIQSHTNPLNEKKEDKKVHFPLSFNIKKGSIINWIKYDELWMAISRVDIVGDAYKSVQIYKCNNVLNKYLYDENNNRKLYQEPCIIDYEITDDSVNYSKKIILPEGTIQVIAQNNNNTKTIQVNDRFIFNGQPFKIEGINSFLRDDIKDVNSVPLLYFSMTKDQISPSDDLTNNIADGLLIHDTGITDIIISPNIIKILQGDIQKYSVYKYDGNNKLNNTFVITAKGCNLNYYDLNIIDGNNFSVQNVKGSGDQYLTVTCPDNTDKTSKDISIRLAGEW